MRRIGAGEVGDHGVDHQGLRLRIPDPARVSHAVEDQVARLRDLVHRRRRQQVGEAHPVWRRAGGRRQGLEDLVGKGALVASDLLLGRPGRYPKMALIRRAGGGHHDALTSRMVQKSAASEACATYA